MGLRKITVRVQESIIEDVEDEVAEGNSGKVKSELLRERLMLGHMLLDTDIEVPLSDIADALREPASQQYAEKQRRDGG